VIDERIPILAPETDNGLLILSRAQWPESESDSLPPIPGFILSSFNPLVIETAERCLSRYYGPAPVAQTARAARTAVVLASAGGDRGTARELASAVESAQRVPALLFFQSNPNAVLGYVAARWGLGGPVVCVGPQRGTEYQGPDQWLDPAGGLAGALAEAALVIGDGDADEALVIVAEQGGRPGESDGAVAVLVTRCP
jgi:hypothetical protein